MKIQSSNIKSNVFICNILLIPSGLSVGRIVGETGASWSVGQVGPRAISLN